MIEAGFRHPTFTVPADDVDRAVAAMVKRYAIGTADAVHRLQGVES